MPTGCCTIELMIVLCSCLLNHMISATLIPNISDFIVVVAIVVFVVMIFMIQKAESCATALVDVLLIIAVGILVIYFLLIINGYF